MRGARPYRKRLTATQRTEDCKALGLSALQTINFCARCANFRSSSSSWTMFRGRGGGRGPTTVKFGCGRRPRQALRFSALSPSRSGIAKNGQHIRQQLPSVARAGHGRTLREPSLGSHVDICIHQAAWPVNTRKCSKKQTRTPMGPMGPMGLMNLVSTRQRSGIIDSNVEPEVRCPTHPHATFYAGPLSHQRYDPRWSRLSRAGHRLWNG
jgi:hypothetical protein